MSDFVAKTADSQQTDTSVPTVQVVTSQSSRLVKGNHNDSLHIQYPPYWIDTWSDFKESKCTPVEPQFTLDLHPQRLALHPYQLEIESEILHPHLAFLEDATSTLTLPLAARCVDNVRIVQRQNRYLYKLFASAIDARGLDINSDTRLLYHGTQKQNIDSIFKKGFNRSSKHVNGAAYGNGTYVTGDLTQALYEKYASTDEDGFKHVIVSQVLVRDKCISADDSVVCSTLLHDTFVVKNDNWIVPLFVISLRVVPAFVSGVADMFSARLEGVRNAMIVWVRSMLVNNKANLDVHLEKLLGVCLPGEQPVCKGSSKEDKEKYVQEKKKYDERKARYEDNKNWFTTKAGFIDGTQLLSYMNRCKAIIGDKKLAEMLKGEWQILFEKMMNDTAPNNLNLIAHNYFANARTVASGWSVYEKGDKKRKENAAKKFSSTEIVYKGDKNVPPIMHMTSFKPQGTILFVFLHRLFVFDCFLIVTGEIKSLALTPVVNPEHPTCISVHVNSDPTPSSFTVVPFSSVADKNAGVIAQVPHGVAHLQALDVQNVPIYVPLFIPSAFHDDRQGYTFQKKGVFGGGYYLKQVDVNITDTLNNSKPALDDVGCLLTSDATERVRKLANSNNLALDNMDSRIYTSRRIINFQSVSVLGNPTTALSVQGSAHTKEQKENHSAVSRQLLEGMDTMCRFGNVCNPEFTEFTRIFGGTVSGGNGIASAVSTITTTTQTAATTPTALTTRTATTTPTTTTPPTTTPTAVTAASILSSGLVSSTGKRRQEQQGVHSASQSPPDKKGKI